MTPAVRDKVDRIERAVGELENAIGTDLDAPAPPVMIPHPRTGEAIAVIAATATDTLAALRDAIVEHERSTIAEWKHAIDAEITRRLDLDGVRSAEVGDWKVTVPAPIKTEWDARAAYNALRRLVRLGLISKDAAGRAATRSVSYSVAHGQLKQLMKHADERVRTAITACQQDAVVPRRNVSVTRIRR